MDTDVRIRCVEAKPLMHRESQGVAGWICRIEVELPSASGFDFIQIPAPPPWRPVERWTAGELEALVRSSLLEPAPPPSPPPPYVKKFRELLAIVRFRQEYVVDDTRPLITEKRDLYELTSR